MTETREEGFTAKEWFEDLVKQADGLQVVFDKARVKAALGRAEMRDLVQRAGNDLEVVRSELRRFRAEAREPSAEIRRNLRELLTDVGQAVQRIAERS